MYISIFHAVFVVMAAGIEWSLDNDASNAAVVVASEAHAITLAVEGLLGVVFTVATLTDEAIDVGEVRLICLFHFWKITFNLILLILYCIYIQIESPRCVSDPAAKCTGQTAALCISMVDSMWLTILDALSLILTRYEEASVQTLFFDANEFTCT